MVSAAVSAEVRQKLQVLMTLIVVSEFMYDAQVDNSDEKRTRAPVSVDTGTGGNGLLRQVAAPQLRQPAAKILP